MPRIRLNFADGCYEEFTSKSTIVSIEILEDKIQIIENNTLLSLKGVWRTSEHFIVKIDKIHDSKKYWLGICKDCGEGKDTLIYDLNGNPVNYPEFGYLKERLDVTFTYNELLKHKYEDK
jgi:hypothetical protein